MSVPRRRGLPWLLLILSLGPLGCGSRDSSSPREGSDAVGELETPGQPPVILVTPDTTLMGAVYDSVAVHFERGEAGRRLLDEPGSWAVDYTWFYLFPDGKELYTFEEMEELAEAGTITDTTRVGLALYRLKIQGETVEEARADVKAKRPREVPPQLRQALTVQQTSAPADTLRPR